MGHYTKIILNFPIGENQPARIKELCEFKFKDGEQFVIQEAEGNFFPLWTFGGAYEVSYFDFEAFLKHISENVKWERPEYVYLIVKKEESVNSAVYSHAGAKLLVDFEYE